MKVLQFTIPVAHDKAVIIQEDVMPYFYPYLHRHREAQLIWIKEGVGTLLVDNQMHAFKKNDIFLFSGIVRLEVMSPYSPKSSRNPASINSFIIFSDIFLDQIFRFLK